MASRSGSAATAVLPSERTSNVPPEIGGGLAEPVGAASPLAVPVTPASIATLASAPPSAVAPFVGGFAKPGASARGGGGASEELDWVLPDWDAAPSGLIGGSAEEGIASDRPSSEQPHAPSVSPSAKSLKGCTLLCPLTIGSNS